MRITKSLLFILSFIFSVTSIAKEKPSNFNSNISPQFALASGCAPSSSQTELDINNIRTTILGGGDMWWDLNDAKYEIPKGGGKHSMFAGAIWVGGVDAGNQLKVAAMTYRQDGNDFWPGPLSIDGTASIDDVTCALYDKHYKIQRSDVEDYVGWLADPTAYPNYTPSPVIFEWPGNRLDFAEPLAPFVDVDGDNYYDPSVGDYPGYDLYGSLDCNADDILFGDQTLWWVYNDKGNIHTETGAEAIGLEIQAQAFAFATNDEINNMTFYSYKIINRSTIQLNDTYFGQWVDPDLGTYDDDYVGCDVSRGLGYCYNGDAEDEGASGYGLNPPAIGVDFFRGPLADANDGVDNDLDGVTDELGEQIIMSKFMYYENDFSVRGNPENATHFYQYLDGFWKDGTPALWGGNGHFTGSSGDATNYMFPGDTDPSHPGETWTEETAGNDPFDRRFIQSAGKFTLMPGAVNTITTGVVWARATSGGPFASVELVRLADDKAQALFDNCFEVLNGPDAPDLTIQELDKELVFILSNKMTSNNYQESYSEKDPLIIGFSDTNYVFEGYQVFQLKNATVSITDIYNPDLARLVFQCDLKNDIKQLVNFEPDESLGGAPVPQDMTLESNDNGISNSFTLNQDLFATGDKTFVNHRSYYYTVIAYGYNNYKTFNPNDPLALDGQKRPYKAGRRNIKTYEAIPHITSPEEQGTLQQTGYGDGPKLTRIAGQGNGGNILRLISESEDDIVSSFNIDNQTYDNATGPVAIKVVDPLIIPDGDFEFTFTNWGTDSVGWVLIRNGGAAIEDIVVNERIIELEDERGKYQYEQIIPQWGMSVVMQSVLDPGNEIENGNGVIGAEMFFEDETDKWLTFLSDVDGESPLNWIRSGTVSTGDYADWTGEDDQGNFENILDGSWAPYRLISNDYLNDVDGDGEPNYGCGPAWSKFRTLNNVDSCMSVEIVFTSDKDKWTRVPVIELSDNASLSFDGAKKFDLRLSNSVDKNGNEQSSKGWGWFPGYAIDLEKGRRLNIMFGEDSWLSGENGRDMLWNPTSKTFEWTGEPSFLLGGKHYIYIMNSEYKGGNEQNNPYYDTFTDNNNAPSDNLKRNIYKEVAWVSIPLASSQESELLSNEVRVSLHVTKPYKDSPKYSFNTDDIQAILGNMETAEDALDLVNVVPNPYYAYSMYETNQVDNRVKITNLPTQCTVNIFSVSGMLVKQFKKDSPETYVEWDLKNSYNLPISSGIYIIHVDAGDIGEKIIKWFGVMRPIDMETF